MIIFVLAIWWGMFWWRGLEQLSAEWFFFLIAYATLLFMWSAMLYPPEFSPHMNFEDYFFSNRYWFFGLQLAVVLIDVPETLVKAAQHLRAVPKEYVFLIPVLVVISLVAMLSSRWRVHEALCLAWLLVTLGYTFFIPLMSRVVGH
jgi:hypothetical protein